MERNIANKLINGYKLMIRKVMKLSKSVYGITIPSVWLEKLGNPQALEVELFEAEGRIEVRLIRERSPWEEKPFISESTARWLLKGKNVNGETLFEKVYEAITIEREASEKEKKEKSDLKELFID